MTMNERIALGVLALDKVAGIVDEKTHSIPHSFRGQISSFGAAVTMGSLTAAVAFFSEQGQSKINRSLLMDAIYVMLTMKKDELNKIESEELTKKLKEKGKSCLLDHLLEYMKKNNQDYIKQEILDNAAALKLAMNAYHLTKEEDGGAK